jgi:chloramphenicol-sensitive protein RarD
VARRVDSKGLAAALAAQVLWGVFPLYFRLLARSGSLEIVAHRICWTLIFCALGITVIGGWSKVRQVLADRRLLLTLLAAGVLVAGNWLIFIIAILTDHIVDSALGYFINPLLMVLMAVIFLKERLRPVQVVVLAIGVVAVIVMAVGVGRVPWIALGLALTFGTYSLVKSLVGPRVTPFIGLGIETCALAPVAVGYLVYLEIAGQGTFSQSWGYAALFAAAGIVTAVPLLLFALGATRLNLVSLAFIHYLTPVFHFLLGVIVFAEHMPTARWIGFVLVWVALAIHSWDIVRQARTPRQPDSDLDGAAVAPAFEEEAEDGAEDAADDVGDVGDPGGCVGDRFAGFEEKLFADVDGDRQDEG